MPKIGTISNDGYDCEIFQDSDGRVHFVADADIDADGANGQNDAKAAYMADDSGAEYLANGGMAILNGRVICAHEWARSIVILGTDNQPKVFPGGMVASTTWYRYPGKLLGDPTAYVDAQKVPYIVVPPLIVQLTSAVVRGCRARASWNGNSIDCVVADRGPRNRIGELSIAAAEVLRMPSSPRNGGVEHATVTYELWPGEAAPGFVLQPA